MNHLLALGALAAPALAATQAMVPLYVYPGNTTWTNPDWSAAVAAIKANPSVHFYVVINPNSGPKNTSDPTGFNGGYCNVDGDPNYVPHGCNRDWTTHLDAINRLDNAQTLGYVWTGYGQRDAADVRADVLEWSQWDTAPTWTAGDTADISIHGLWFDEMGIDPGNATHYLDIMTYANETFGVSTSSSSDDDDDDDNDDHDDRPYTIVLNAGPVPNATYEAQLFGMASAVVTKETCFTSDPAAHNATWDCPPPYAPFSYGALAAGDGLPHDAAFLPQTVVIVHQFAGPPAATQQTLKEQLDGVVALGVHSTYFTGGSWHQTTVAPATIGAVGKLLAAANGARRSTGWGGGGGGYGLVRWLPWVCAYVNLQVYWSY